LKNKRIVFYIKTKRCLFTEGRIILFKDFFLGSRFFILVHYSLLGRGVNSTKKQYTTIQYYKTTTQQDYKEQYHNTTTPQLYNTTILQNYKITTTQHNNTATLQYYNATTLQQYNTTTLQD